MFWERFTKLCKDNSTSPNAVCKDLGKSNATATHWKNGSMPKGDILSKIAQYFNVTSDYLLGLTDIPNVYEKRSQEETILLPDEKVLISSYRALDSSDKDKITGYTAALLDSEKYKISEKKAI